MTTKGHFHASSASLSKLLIKGLTILLLTATNAMALDINITARYSPAQSILHANSFENTTPNSGYCVNFPASCAAADSFSVSFPGANGLLNIAKGDNVELRAPIAWREFEVTNSEGYSQKVKMRIVGLGGTYHTASAVSTITGQSNFTAGHNALWSTGSWTNPPAGCLSPGSGASAERLQEFFWNFKSSGTCTKTANFDVRLGFDKFSFMYELETPNPLKMQPGTYTGNVLYTIGQSGDIKYGDGISAYPNVNFKFTLTIQHDLRIQFPTAADKLALQPEGGWQQWLYNGSRYTPKKLLANQPYQIWASGKFKMQLQCQYPVGNDCGIQNSSQTTLIPVKTMVTLPYNLRNNNQPVSRYPLTNNTPAIFQPEEYVNSEKSTLHFEVDKTGVEQMINSGGGSFRGDVTVIWDSEF